MDARRPPLQCPHRKPVSGDEIHGAVSPPAAKASDVFPLPLYLTNAVFFTLFFSVAYYLFHRRRDKIWCSTPLHVLNFSEITAIVALIASFIYLLGFFGIDFVQSFISRASSDGWDLDEPSSYLFPQDLPPSLLSSEEDEEIVKSVVEGKVQSYALESQLGDCKRAAEIRREALRGRRGGLFRAYR